MQILLFGDSIAYGAFDRMESGWAARLRKFIDQKLADNDHYFMFYNLGVDGDSTKELLKRMESEIIPRLKEPQTMIIISLGGRDAVTEIATGKTYTSTLEFEENLKKIIGIARKYTTKLLFVGVVGPRDESKTHPIEWMPEYASENKYIKKFNGIERRVCKENGVHFIDIFSKFEKLDYKSLLEDGIHPNSKGHKKVFSMVRSYLVKKELLKNEMP